MARRLSHFNDPRLEAQIEELIQSIRKAQETAEAVSFNVDGGRPGSEYGGYELIDGGGV